MEKVSEHFHEISKIPLLLLQFVGIIFFAEQAVNVHLIIPKLIPKLILTFVFNIRLCESNNLFHEKAFTILLHLNYYSFYATVSVAVWISPWQTLFFPSVSSNKSKYFCVIFKVDSHCFIWVLVWRTKMIVSAHVVSLIRHLSSDVFVDPHTRQWSICFDLLQRRSGTDIFWIFWGMIAWRDF